MRKFLSELKRVNPQIGGPDQIVMLTLLGGAHWLSRLEAPESAQAVFERTTRPALHAGVLGANVIYAGTIDASQVNAGGFTGHTLTLNSNGVLTEITNSTYTRSQYAGLTIKDTAYNWRAYVCPQEIGVQNTAGGPSAGFYGAIQAVPQYGSTPAHGAVVVNASDNRTASLDPTTGLSLPNSGYGDHPLVIGNYYLWVGMGGELRIKYGAPTSDGDGVAVGSQS